MHIMLQKYKLGVPIRDMRLLDPHLATNETGRILVSSWRKLPRFRIATRNVSCTWTPVADRAAACKLFSAVCVIGTCMMLFCVLSTPRWSCMRTQCGGKSLSRLRRYRAASAGPAWSDLHSGCSTYVLLAAQHITALLDELMAICLGRCVTMPLSSAWSMCA